MMNGFNATMQKEQAKRILVTGANGFIGHALCNRMATENCQITAAVRNKSISLDSKLITQVLINNISLETDWNDSIIGINTVVHLAARVHVMSENTTKTKNAYRQVNVEGTKKLAEDAAKAGIKRFLFLSSVKVNGEETDIPYKEHDTPSPEDEYAVSKLEAEEQLKSIADRSGMEVVIIRPPLVYGPGVKANFLTLMKLIDKRIPLPLGSVNNRRSFIYLGNLVDCIVRCINHPDAANQTYLVSDGRDLSTPELIRLIAASLNRYPFLYPFPEKILHSIANLIGKKEVASRLIGSLTVDCSKIERQLGWTPPYSTDSGLKETAEWFKKV